jgi:hypothetical protein
MSKTFWTCTNCNEEVESQFEVCWNCQRDRTGTIPPSFSSLEIEDRAEKERLNAKEYDKYCLACQTLLEYAGTKRFHSGPSWGALGDWAELLIGQTALEMFFCPACGRVEFFMQATSR